MNRLFFAHTLKSLLHSKRTSRDSLLNAKMFLIILNGEDINELQTISIPSSANTSFAIVSTTVSINLTQCNEYIAANV